MLFPIIMSHSGAVSNNAGPFVQRSPRFHENVIKERAIKTEDFVGRLASPCAQTKAYVFEKKLLRTIYL
jgi:hypothetical protein